MNRIFHRGLLFEAVAQVPRKKNAMDYVSIRIPFVGGYECYYYYCHIFKKKSDRLHTKSDFFH